jgi:hypothetical protein
LEADDGVTRAAAVVFERRLAALGVAARQLSGEGARLVHCLPPLDAQRRARTDSA